MRYALECYVKLSHSEVRNGAVQYSYTKSIPDVSIMMQSECLLRNNPMERNNERRFLLKQMTRQFELNALVLCTFSVAQSRPIFPRHGKESPLSFCKIHT
jgi:hypothetical protein